jgi:hypothetical protein
LPIDLLDKPADHRLRKQQLTEAQKKAKAAAIAAAAKQCAKTDGKKLVDPHGLRARGITYHPTYLRKLWERGDFPPPFNLSKRRIVWDEITDIDPWIEAKRFGIEWRLVKEAMGK